MSKYCHYRISVICRLQWPQLMVMTSSCDIVRDCHITVCSRGPPPPLPVDHTMLCLYPTAGYVADPTLLFFNVLLYI